MSTNAKLPHPKIYFRLNELATSPETPAKKYIDPQGRIRNISAKPAHKGITPLGKSTILRWSSDGRFPAPNRSLKGITVWSAVAVNEWLEKLGQPVNDSAAEATS
jgi:predicted DNA-binding transcriptional regulator AlpA